MGFFSSIQRLAEQRNTPKSADADAPEAVQTPGHLAETELDELLSAMPLAVVLVNDSSVIAFANPQAAKMVGERVGALLNQSILAFVHPDDVAFTLGLIDSAGEYEQMVLGPARIRYLDGHGEARWTQLWARATPASLGGKGYILTLAPESMRDVLASVVPAIAATKPTEDILTAVTNSTRGHPISARSAVVYFDSDGAKRVIGHWPVVELSPFSHDTPWGHCFVRAESTYWTDVAHNIDDPGVVRSLERQEINAIWAWPVINTAGAVVAVFVIWYYLPAPPSLNQQSYIDDAINLVRLAVDQWSQRRNLQLAALQDGLTGVSNRSALHQRAHLDRRRGDVLFVDLDDFKKVNDNYGHATGDEVIRSAAHRLVSVARATDEVYRVGGDEFVVIAAPSTVINDELDQLAERIVEAFGIPFECSTGRHLVTASVGIAHSENSDLPSTMKRADKALYQAKGLGRSRFHRGE